MVAPAGDEDEELKTNGVRDTGCSSSTGGGHEELGAEAPKMFFEDSCHGMRHRARSIASHAVIRSSSGGCKIHVEHGGDQSDEAEGLSFGGERRGRMRSRLSSIGRSKSGSSRPTGSGDWGDLFFSSDDGSDSEFAHSNPKMFGKTGVSPRRPSGEEHDQAALVRNVAETEKDTPESSDRNRPRSL